MVYAPILPIEPKPAPDELQVAVIKGRNQLVKPVGIRRWKQVGAVKGHPRLWAFGLFAQPAMHPRRASLLGGEAFALQVEAIDSAPHDCINIQC